jgi:hypothetical protein
MKRKISQTEIKANLELLSNTEIKTNDDDFYVIHLNTPKGKKIIRTQLTLDEWLKENSLIKKKKYK